MAGERFEIEPETSYREPSKFAGCFKGCLIVGVVLLVAFCVIGFWISQNWQKWAADFGSQALNQVIDQSDLPDLEKEETKVQVERLAGAVREGKLSGQQLGRVIEQVFESPLMTLFAVASIEKEYIEPSGLDGQEKVAARIALRRFVRGLIANKIDEANFEVALSKIADEGANGQWELREKVTDDQLRELIQFAQDKADAAEIPAEAKAIDVSNEMRRIIDSALGESTEQPGEPENEPWPE